jgi:hypothetical protein
MANIGQAPGDLRTLQAFVNTLDIEEATDELASPAALDEWLATAGLISDPGSGPPARRAAAAAGPAARLAGVAAAAAPPAIAVRPDGSVGLGVSTGGDGSRAALTRLLLIAAQAAVAGTWARLKACSADDCHWVFYDRSPTRNGCWCSMQICGSRAKSRAYRSRSLLLR